jgi:hypothetical protein
VPSLTNPNNRYLALLLAVMALIGAALLAARPQPVPPRPIGLFTSLPILWEESEDLAGLLRSEAPPHWARTVIAERGAIVPLDLLTALRPGLSRLVIAQPRPLSPEENVALDRWVRGGGRLVLLADPALTEHSRFPVGDPRRPQDLVLLSPILARWGLELVFVEDQPRGERMIALSDGDLPVDLPGSWRTLQGGTCVISGEGVLAECRIGSGRVLALADAALLDRNPGDARRARMLGALLDRGFAD